MFASKTPESLTSRAAADLCARCQAEFDEDGSYSEDEHRDSHQPPQNNEPNGILVAFRQIDAGRGEYADWLSDFDAQPHFWTRGHDDPNARYPQYTPGELDHARRVLTRLATLAEQESPSC